MTEQFSNKRCDKRDFGDGIVCVCNATYCDTIEPNFRLSASQYAVYSTTKSGDRLEKTIHEFRKDVSHSGEYKRVMVTVVEFKMFNNSITTDLQSS